MKSNEEKMGARAELILVRPPLPAEAYAEILQVLNKYRVQAVLLREERYLLQVQNVIGGPEEALDRESDLLLEMLVARGDWKNASESLKHYLKLSIPENSLHIVDPYLFPNKYDSNYIEDFVAIIESQASGISDLHLYIMNRNKTLESQIIQRLNTKMTHLSVKIYETNVFHDRFWIADSRRGFVVGTSLNGLGKKISIIAWLTDQDVEDIMNECMKL